jgi:SAM-dependent methyltransferase
VSDAQEHEFDDVASWTAELLADADRSAAIAAACRGSGSPAALAWLARSLDLGPDVQLLDLGSGLGGPAAWVADHHGAPVVGVEPMEGAARGSTRLLGLSSVVATADDLPFPDRSFAAAWALAVLDTVDRPERMLAEVRRCLVPGGGFGLVAYVADAPIAEDDLPEGNRFPTTGELLDDLAAAGFEVIDRMRADALAPMPDDWREQQDEVDAALERRHGDDPRWIEARENEEAFAALLEDGRVESVLVSARVR